ncbi:carbohydrate kinase [Polaribacter reichenbachii]|uniref:Carbohydrate kinase n=1 Tax=Polaribacter reichenbachii TaxID=996801 RepID=A0A1B8TUV8_9FLAO|nr:FGGY family carbohydrate kinase [Polaribacter reichenbachii]APZ45546.1 carbohydrate kinase [Polaribacter reichenbachii]AUC19408.1 carbohydrate kinase [Polaribacter reichenbachii]OBY63437.1 carbohydrate kinase [Polaribacter reichenbachii]
MYYIGYDIGSSSIKVALVDAKSGANIITKNEPEAEMEILAVQNDWAEQDPEMWWNYICIATKKAIAESGIDASKITGIGISYQMHGLVVVDENLKSLRNSIIWCDSRAVAIGNKAFNDLEEKCTEHLLNSPGNFTASKLKWVKDNEPEVYDKIHKYMLPGDFIAAKLSGKVCTTKNSLSEGILWDYKEDKVADWLLEYYGISPSLTPEVVDNFTNQGEVHAKASEITGLPKGIPIVYRAGDQPNNALSLNVFNPGEVAATGGTSGVIYAVTDQLKSKESIRINNFAHINYAKNLKNVGKLLCINGSGILYRWLKNNLGDISYEEMNEKASQVAVGSEGVSILPFGNGAERMLNNTNIGAHFVNVNFNIHNNGHLYRAALEGIAFSFVYGMEILKNDNAKIDVIRAGNDNLFRSEIFSNTVATLIGQEIEIYNTTGAIGAARAVGLRNGDFKTFGENITNNDHVMTFVPLKNKKAYEEAYQNWKTELEKKLSK